MIVICIKGDDLREVNGLVNPDDHSLEEGKKYTVVDEIIYGRQRFYILAERPIDCCYHERRFAPTSSIDETTFERNYNKEPQLK